jgi:putative MATE family efflux protein
VKTQVTYREIWQIAYPIILGSVAQNILNVTDTAFLGRVGEIELGAGAIGGIFYFVIVMLGWGFGIGAQIMIARRNGEGNHKEIGRTVEHALYFLIPLALVLYLAMELFSSQILGRIIRSPEIYQATDEFIHYRSYGIFFTNAGVLFRAFYVGIANTKIITWSTLVSAVSNILLDYLLIFGKFGFPEMGIGGAALASTIAEGIGLTYFAVHVFLRIERSKYALFRFSGFDPVLFWKSIKVSSPIMLQNFISLSAWFVFFLFVEKLGEQALAVSNIIRSFYVVLMIPMWGFSSATNTLVSNLIGQGRGEEVMSLSHKIARLCFLGVLGIVLLGYLFPEASLRIYTGEEALIAASLPVLYVVNIAALLLSVAFIYFNAVSGTGKTNISFMIEVAVIIVYLVMTYIVAGVVRADISVVWTVEYVYAVLMGTAAYFYLAGGKWKSARV